MLIIILLFKLLSSSPSDSTVALSPNDSLVHKSELTKNMDSNLSLDNFSDYHSSNNDNNQVELLKIWVPAIIALIVLLITNLVTLLKIRKESSESLKREITIAKINLENDKLKNFYNPIYTLLSTNSDIFVSFGPNSFPIGDDLRSEAAVIWNKMVVNIIIPNNRRIGEIIIHYSHLIHNDDNLSNYLDFLKHLESYEHFVKFPNSIHKGHKYPKDFIANVSEFRSKILNELKEIETKLMS